MVCLDLKPDARTRQKWQISSTIRDTDMAQTYSNYTKEQILVQTSTSMLAQANAMPQSVLRLIQ